MSISSFAGPDGPSAPIRAWRSPRGLLLHHGPERTIGIDELLARAGQSGHDSPAYLLVDSGGAVVETFSVTTGARRPSGAQRSTSSRAGGC